MSRFGFSGTLGLFLQIHPTPFCVICYFIMIFFYPPTWHSVSLCKLTFQVKKVELFLSIVSWRIGPFHSNSCQFRAFIEMQSIKRKTGALLATFQVFHSVSVHFLLLTGPALMYHINICVKDAAFSLMCDLSAVVATNNPLSPLIRHLVALPIH